MHETHEVLGVRAVLALLTVDCSGQQGVIQTLVYNSIQQFAASVGYIGYTCLPAIAVLGLTKHNHITVKNCISEHIFQSCVTRLYGDLLGT